MKRLPVLSLFFLIFYNISIGQSYQVEGVILDASNETPLLSASVIAINNVDSLLASFGITNDSGQFRLNDLKPGSYSIQVTYLGYEAYKKDIVLTEDIGDFDMGNLMLVPKSELIEGVEIEGERVPISIRKDTIVYNADAFKTNPNDNVEDLLKKMPGIEVEEDGTIKAQGEEVQQVLVDGKEFFGNDVKIATQNLPAKAIDEVEVYDKKSDLAEFSGIDDGEREKTINLELKEDYKKGYFGNVKAGYGTDERYDGKLSLNRFDKKTQLSLIGNINNINEQGFSIDSYASFVGGMGNLARGRGRSDLPINRGLSDGFVNTASGGLNYNYEFNKKTELRSNYFINKIENTLNDSTFRENFLSRNSYFSDQTNKQNSSNFNHKINVEIRHDIDSTSDLKVRTGFNFNTTEISNLGTTRTIQEDQIFFPAYQMKV